MKINGTTFPNFNKGYTTEVKFPFSISKLGNNKISIWDAGNYYDQYKCSGKLVLTGAEMDSLFNIYNSSARGQSVTLTECQSTGFYPFGPAVADTSFTVYIDDIKNRGMTDLVAKRFTVELTFLWEYPTSGGASTITWNNPLPYCKEGSLTFLNYTDVNFPGGGFKIKKGLGVVNQNPKGSQFYGVFFPILNNEWEESEFTLNLKNDLASNLIYNLINTYRSNTIFIEGGANYYIFGRDKGDETQFSVKFNNDTLKIKHVNEEDFEVKFEVVKL
jgi:hypothetical protein